jgi:5,5'-dehydrodivanillate O-demethylase
MQIFIACRRRAAKLAHKMMSQAENERFTRVGPGTPMGDLMRRYWHPIAGVSELKRTPVKPVRLLGEDLVLYRDGQGNLGLIDRQCCHRRADLSYGIVETCGLRCHYHGWLFNHEGRCLEQPFEDIANPQAKFRDKVRIKAYPVASNAGMVWAYLGPDPAPLVPNWEPFTWTNGFRQVVFANVPCNWFQCQENSCDPVHFEWMHRNWAGRMANRDREYGPKHLKVEFDEVEFGHIYRRIREDTDENNEHWTVGVMALWPNAFFVGDHIEWRVPVDDETTLSVTWSFARVPSEKEPYVQEEIPAWYGPVKDPDTGRWITSHVMNQDFVAWVGQGRIADRSKEHLGKSDGGIIKMRRAFKEAMDIVAAGGEPRGIIRDAKKNECIVLPIKHREAFTTSQSREQIIATGEKLGYRFMRPEYLFQAGMPDDVRRAYQQAMGICE